MTNLFSIIKNAIMQNYTPTYGDLINENKGEVLNNAIHNMCTDEEFEQYTSIMNNDKARLQQYSNTTQPSQQIKKPQMNRTITVCGIGEVNQIC
jgi:ribose 5-phosphate isomerase RpiB